MAEVVGVQSIGSADRPQPAAGERPDAALLKQVRNGDAAAFGVLVARHQDRVFNVCLRLSGQEADALDLTQTVFMKAYGQLAKFDGRAQFSTWIYRIAVNTALSGLRDKKRRRRVVTSDAALAEQPAGDPPPGAALDAEERRQSVAAALAKLDEAFRAAVVLKDIEQLDYQAIAEILQVPLGTVKSRIARGRQMLRELLKESPA